MSEISRYRVVNARHGFDALHEDAAGPYVTYDDHAAKVAELERAVGEFIHDVECCGIHAGTEALVYAMKKKLHKAPTPTEPGR